MNLRNFAILVDQSVHREVTPWLRNREFDAVATWEQEMARWPDERLLNWARDNDRIVLTHDSGFGRLLLESSSAALGVVILRPAHRGLPETLLQLAHLIEHNPEAERPFVIVSQQLASRGFAIRVRTADP